MKRIAMALALLLTAGVIYAQNIDDLIKDFKNKKGAEYIKLDDLESGYSPAWKSLMDFTHISVDNAGSDDLMSPEDSAEFVKMIFGSIGVKSIEVLGLDNCNEGVQEDFVKKTKKFSPKGYDLMMSGKSSENNQDARVFTRGEGSNMELLVINRAGEDKGVMRLTGAILSLVNQVFTDGDSVAVEAAGTLHDGEVVYDGSVDDEIADDDSTWSYLGNVKDIDNLEPCPALADVPDSIRDMIAQTVSYYKGKEGAVYDMQTAAAESHIKSNFVRYYGGDESDANGLVIRSWERLSLYGSEHALPFSLVMKSIGDASHISTFSYVSGDNRLDVYYLKGDKDGKIEEFIAIANNPQKRITHFTWVKGKIDSNFVTRKLALHEVTF